MKRMLLFFTALLAFIGASGCSAEKAVHDKSYLRAVSIYGDEEKNAVFSFYSEDSDSIRASGDSIDSACKAAGLKCGKDIFTGHTELVILGECDYAETLEFLLNEWKVSPSCLVAYSSEDVTDLLVENDAERIVDSIRMAQERNEAPRCDIVTVLSGLIGKSGTAEVVMLDGEGISGNYIIKR